MHTQKPHHYHSYMVHGTSGCLVAALASLEQLLINSFMVVKLSSCLALSPFPLSLSRGVFLTKMYALCALITLQFLRRSATFLLWNNQYWIRCLAIAARNLLLHTKISN